jgi:curved DNA-binding protein CbpA
MNLYDELGLNSNCTSDEIKQRYRALAQQHHPDKGGDEDTFKKIKLAYEVLSDPSRRSDYDSTGKIYEDISVRTEALQELAGLVKHCINKINPEYDDLILLMKHDLIDTSTQVYLSITKCEEYIFKLKKILKKINRKKEGENFIKSVIEEQLKICESDLDKFNHKIEVIDYILELLEDYYYGLDLSTLLEGVIPTEWQPAEQVIE